MLCWNIKSSSCVRREQVRQGLLPVKSLGRCSVLVHRSSVYVWIGNLFTAGINDNALSTLFRGRAISCCAKVKNLEEELVCSRLRALNHLTSI